MRISDWSSDVCSSDLDVDELRAMFRDKSEGLKGRLRIDMPSGAAKHLVVPHLAEFMRAHPQLQIDLGSADRRVDLVSEGIDCVLRVGQLRDSSLFARPLVKVQVISCAIPGYLERHGVPRTTQDQDPQPTHIK